MKISFITAVLLIVSSVSFSQVIYPKAKKVNQSDDYFGTKVNDPYRWLEDDNATDTKEWVQQENRVTFDYLSAIPYRQKIKDRLTSLWNFPKMTSPFRKGDFYFYYKNDGLQNQNVLYYEKSFKSKPILLLDPNKFSEDGTVSLSLISVSKDCKYLAYAISKAGSDWEEIHVLEIATKKQMTDKLEWVKFSNISWQGQGFYYSRYDAPESAKAFTKKNEFHKVYYHVLGTPQSKEHHSQRICSCTMTNSIPTGTFLLP
jgi:prolyl oligopeptidase